MNLFPGTAKIVTGYDQKLMMWWWHSKLVDVVLVFLKIKSLKKKKSSCGSKKKKKFKKFKCDVFVCTLQAPPWEQVTSVSSVLSHV